MANENSHLQQIRELKADLLDACNQHKHHQQVFMNDNQDPYNRMRLQNAKVICADFLVMNESHIMRLIEIAEHYYKAAESISERTND